MNNRGLECFKRLKVVALCAVLAIGLWPPLDVIAQSSKQTSQYESNNWTGGAYSNATTGEFSYCVASTTFDTGTQVAFVLYVTNVLQLMLANANWDLGDFPEYDISIQIDDQLIGKFDARSTQKDTLLIQFGHEVGYLERLSAGGFLVVNPGPEALVFALKDTKRALEQLQSCVKREITPPVSRNPFSGAVRTNPFAPSQSAD